MFYPINTLNWATTSYGIYAINFSFFFLSGHDMSSIYLNSFENCLASCVSTVNCTHVTYVSNGLCWLKYGPRSQYDASAMSGVQSAILNQSNVFNF